MSEQGLHPSSGLLGRAHECTAIDGLLEGARRGRSGSLVVRGDAGIGKTALLAYAAERARDNMTVLAVTGVEGESDLAFAGLHGLLGPIVDALDGVPAAQRQPLEAALGLSPGVGRDRFLVSAGVLSLLAAAAESRPILCLVDDAQWLDVPSANALSFTARRLLAEDVVILFGARDGEARCFDAAGLEEIEVGGLDRDAAVVVLDQGSRQAAPSVRERLLGEAAGNPLALQELPAGLSDAQLDGTAPLPDALPMTHRLRSAFSQRIEPLPESARAALLIAAAEEAGELAVTLRAAAELGLPPDALDPAEEAGLVRIDGGALSFEAPPARTVSLVRVGAAGPAPAHTRSAGRRAGRRAARRARTLAPCEGDAERRRGHRGRARSFGTALPAPRRSRFGSDCFRASRGAQRGHPVTREASIGGSPCGLVSRADRQGSGPRKPIPAPDGTRTAGRCLVPERRD